MTKRAIRKFGDPVLRENCQAVTDFTAARKIVRDMAHTLDSTSSGAALAAPQIGITQRIVVMYHKDDVLTLINPVITSKTGQQTGLEGCLSLPGVYGTVTRANTVTVETTNLDGEKTVIEAEGFMARCLQHEIDHLDGILYIDHVEQGELFDEKTDEPIDVYELVRKSKPNALTWPAKK